ncbi:SMP-30/gluconolactonase/LRE family protein [Novosphingobium beihaiensis]|uniref:SMP-30/gluconolactonase/LRE family protein n=1 Tax=Novosphingobium beihaiensis TaxID=2930389 RepID=A0ABT0BRC7_9SPHN|nr:SMP-30/gluconolactonase/LRE family protein [Novosphingobium beihaiensis]MCJ2187609.1 SMP-30/gluconolactonase/LRE family protein [Novosphingobium beihaiensis]
MELDVIAEGLHFPEGPVVMPDGSIIFVELIAGRLSRAWGDGKVETIAELGACPAGAALGPDGAVYVANIGGMDFATMDALDGPGNEGRIERVDLATGKSERLYDSCDGLPLSAPDDLVFDGHGGFWFTDLGKDFARHREYGGLYYAKPDGSLITCGRYPAVALNGVGLSPDGKTLYTSSTTTSRLWRIPVLAPGQLEPAPDVSRAGSPATGDLMATIPGDCGVDSLAVTASGAVCVATLYRGGITTVREDGTMDYLHLPDEYTTNIAFGGEDMRSAYITLSASGRIVRVRWNEPGLKLNYGLY